MPADPAHEASVLARVDAELRAWRAAHPHATLSEIEATLDQRLRAARAQLLSQVVADASVPTHCPACGTTLQQRGRHRRRLRTDGDQPVELERAYATCPVCGTGLFPPR
jgi:rubrerythrin